MSKSKQIRELLAGGELPVAAINEKLGGTYKQTLDLCKYLQHRGELKIRGDGAAHYARLARRIQGNSKQRRETPTGNAPAKTASLAELLADNYRKAGAELRAVVIDQVEAYQDNASIVRALAAHERAERLIAACEK